MRRAEHLLYIARERTNNTDYAVDASGNPTRGISDMLCLEYVNQAQDHLQTTILNAFPNEFVYQQIISIVANQEAYSVPDNLFANHKLISVEYSPSGLLTDYRPLPQGTIRDRDTSTGEPYQYIRRTGQILLNSIKSTSTGTLRVSYYRELDNVDIRRGTVNGTPSGTTIATTGMDAISKPINATNVDYICISDSDGNVLLYNGKISSWSTPNFTLAANVSTYLVTGYTLANLASQYITFGKYSTTHSKLPDICERYLITSLQKRLLTKDVSNSSIEEDAELMKMEADIISTYNDESRDVEYMPVIDNEIIY